MKFLQNHDEYFKIEFLCGELSKNDDFKIVSNLFYILSDSNRLKIFWLLCHSKESVSNISNIMKMTNPAISHHLKILKDANLVQSYRDGKEVFYTSSKEATSQTLHGIIEKLMSITCPDFDEKHEKINENSEYLEDQVNKIKQVHDYLMNNLSKRITIDELAKQFAMNSTTLKTVFKDVYGSSLAAHIKEHRMERAADFLVNSDKSVNEISNEVGYESQSKFSAAFKDFYKTTPVEYRKNNAKR